MMRKAGLLFLLDLCAATVYCFTGPDQGGWIETGANNIIFII
jgi:hypothetical protein